MKPTEGYLYHTHRNLSPSFGGHIALTPSYLVTKLDSSVVALCDHRRMGREFDSQRIHDLLFSRTTLGMVIMVGLPGA